MKRMGILWLCFCLLLSLAACGTAPVQPAEGTDTEISSELTATSDDVIEIGWSDGTVEFSPRYLHTNGGKEGERYPLVHVIRSAEDLTDYEATAGQDFDLRELSALGYDQAFFAKKALVFIVLEEPSSSNRHKVEQIKRRKNGDETDFRVEISSIVPETGDCAMAQWHIVLEIPKDEAPEVEAVSVYKDGILMKKKALSVTYCFGTDSATTFSGGQAETLLGILQNLNYDPMRICNCAPQYQVKTEGETYGIHLEEGYVRCSAGQAELTEDQLSALRELHDWAKEQPSDLCGYPTEEYFNEFSFFLTWGFYGESSYDSRTGRLVKTVNATKPEDYVTTYHLSEEQKEKVYALIQGLDLASYPDFYDPHEGKISSDPSMTLVLSVTVGGMQKTVQAKEIALGYKANNEKGQRFLTVCREISSLLTETEAWKSLPEYEFFYN